MIIFNRSIVGLVASRLNKKLGLCVGLGRVQLSLSRLSRSPEVALYEALGVLACRHRTPLILHV